MALQGYYQRCRRRLFIAGVLFGLAVALRIHVAPVVGLAMMWTSFRSFAERFPLLLAGALIATMFGGLIDWVSWSYPFESTWQNVVLNLAYGVSASYGTHSWYAFITIFLSYWGAAAAILLMLALIGGLRFPMCLALALLRGR